MTNKLKLFSYILFIVAFIFSVTVGRLLGECFVGDFIAALPPILQNPILTFFCVALPLGLYVNPYENRYLWAKFIDKLDSEYQQRSKIAPLNAGIVVGFFSAWTSPSTALIDFFWGS
jgi:hypothetical protein